MSALMKRAGAIGALVTTTVVGGGMAGATAVHAEPQGYVPAQLDVGYFYGTFGEDPNVVLMVGGSVEDFCLDDPDDPFNAEPGVAPLRVFERADGTVDLKVDDGNQPIFLYESEVEAPDFIVSACADFFDGDPETGVPAPFASGTADLKVRISLISEDVVDVFNSVNGTAATGDGIEYKVRASADLVVEGGVPQGAPEDFVSLTLTEIRRGA